MPTRTAGEKAKIEKRIRLERTLLPVVCVLGIAAFILISALLGKTSTQSAEPELTPAPTEDPALTAIDAVMGSFSGDMKSGGDAYMLSYRSPYDGEFGTVSTYDKQGMLCMKIVRPFFEAEPEPTEDPFSQMFEPTPVPTQGAGETEAPNESIIGISDELCSLLSFVYKPSPSDDVSGKLTSALVSIWMGEQTKASIIYGVYLLKLEYDSSDRILTVTCAPA